MVTFLAVSNDISLQATDIGEIYSKARSQEKAYIVVGDGEGYTIITYK